MGSPYMKRRERRRRTGGESRQGLPSKPSTINPKMSIPTSQNFASCYMELCKQHHVRPLPVICVTRPYTLDFTTDRVKMDDWGPILNSLSLDRSLRTVSVRSRYQCRKPLEEVNSEDKARSMARAPVVLTRYLLEWLSHSVAQCVRNSPALTSLELEGIPLPTDCLAALCVGLAGTETLQHLSLQRCYIGDESCELICRTVADVRSIRSLNLSQCDLTENSGSALAAALSRQKLLLYHETWKESLRYREPNLDAMSSLRRLTLNGNPRLGDGAVSQVIEAINDSLWLKALDLQQCGLTDFIGKEIVQLLDYNSILEVVDVRFNSNMSQEVLEDIFQRLETNNNSAVRCGKSEYRWMSLPQKDNRNAVSAGDSRKNRYEDPVDSLLASRPRSAFASSKTKRPCVPNPVKRNTLINSVIAKRTKMKINNGTITSPVKKIDDSPEDLNERKKITGEERSAHIPEKLSVHLDLQTQIDSVVSNAVPNVEDSSPEESDSINIIEKVSESQESPKNEEEDADKLKTVLEQLSEARLEQDRLLEERRKMDILLAEERNRRKTVESHLQEVQTNLADLKAALKEKEQETRGCFLISQRSLDEIAASFNKLLEMLENNMTRHPSSTRRYDDCIEEEWSMARAEIRKRVANLIRKSKSESHGRNLRIECNETGIIEASTTNSMARKFAKSEGDVRNSLPPIVQPIRLERNVGDSPDVMSVRNHSSRRATGTNYTNYNEDSNKMMISSPCERARAIFAQIVNGDAILHFDAHGS